MSLEGKVALVTGASRGIGRAIALRLAQDGAAVTVNYSGSERQAQEVVASIEQAGGRALAVQADVSRVADGVRLFDAALERFGRLDILVNNAGVILYKLLAETTEEEFDRLMAVNVKGTYLCCQQAARRMAAGGRIVNLSLVNVPVFSPQRAAGRTTSASRAVSVRKASWTTTSRSFLPRIWRTRASWGSDTAGLVATTQSSLIEPCSA